MRPLIRIPVAAMLALATIALPAARATERSDIDARYKWDTTALYANDAAWASARTDLTGRITPLAAYKGHLGESAAGLFKALDDITAVRLGLDRLATYASMRANEDERISSTIEMRDAAMQLYVQMGAVTAYVRPEVIALGPDKIQAFLAAEPRLAPYRQFLEDLARFAPHTLSAAEEQIAAQAGRLAFAGGSIRNIFNNAELPWPTVTLSTGETIRLDDAAYTQYRQSSVKADRDTVFRAFFRAHRQFQATYGAALNSKVQADLFEKSVHHFSSCLEAATFGDNIPTRVYTQLLDDVHANLPTLHRYLKLRQRMMGLPQLRYEDLYAPIVQSLDEKHYTPEEAMDVVLAAVAPLGQGYVDTLRHGFHSGWIDWMPSTGKQSGAYSTGVYGAHPFQLLNFTGMHDEVGTLAHESGHSMHTLFAMQHQPYVTSDYATFVAEVASTLNENLLFHYELDHTKDKAQRLYLLGSQLDNLRGTLFRQAMFAEFELAMHERAEKGQPLSGEGLTKMYLEIVRRYYGHDAGVCLVDDLYGTEWSYIPHFFRNFYVYQYSTSIIASTALANGIRTEALAKKGTAKRDAYLRMLQSGSSKFPIDLLRDAGVDMTTSAPFQASMREMNAIMDEMEKLLATK